MKSSGDDIRSLKKHVGLAPQLRRPAERHSAAHESNAAASADFLGSSLVASVFLGLFIDYHVGIGE